MIFRGWQKTSLIEYPDKIATVLFCGGCNFRCPFCYNPELVLKPELLSELSDEMVFVFLNENRSLYQAVVLTGGEPTMDPTLPDFLVRVKKLGLLTGLETNGTNPQMLRSLIELRSIDFVALDIKAPMDWPSYRKACRLDAEELFEAVRQSLEILLGSDLNYEVRTTVVPPIHSRNDILRMGEQLKGATRYVLQQFIPDRCLEQSYRSIVPYSRDNFIEWQKELGQYVGQCDIRTV